MTNDVIWAGEQEGQKVKKVKKIDTGGDNFTYTGTRPRYKNQIWREGSRRRYNRLF